MFSCSICVNEALALFINLLSILNHEGRGNRNFFSPGVILSGFQIKYIFQLNPETRSLRELTLVVSVWFSETQGLG